MHWPGSAIKFDVQNIHRCPYITHVGERLYLQARKSKNKIRDGQPLQEDSL